MRKEYRMTWSPPDTNWDEAIGEPRSRSPEAIIYSARRYLIKIPADLEALRQCALEGAALRTPAAIIDALIGFAASVIVGIVVALLLSTSKLVQRAFYPYTVFFQTVPIVAIAPLLVIWFGAGLKSVATCAFIVSVFPVIANTLGGLLSTDPALRDMFRLYGASGLAKMWKLKLPSALPNIFTGMRIAAGLAVIGTIVGEFVAGLLEENPGLGILVVEAKKIGRTDLVFAAVLAASLLGLAMLATVNLAGYLTLRRWHASEQE